MQSDETSPGGSGTSPDDAAASGNLEPAHGTGAGPEAGASGPIGTPGTPQPASPWQTLPGPWTPPAPWAQPPGQTPWQPTPPPAQPGWAPAPAPQPAPSWQSAPQSQPAPSWPPQPTSQSPWQPIGQPPAGDVTRRRPSRAPQVLMVIAAVLFAFAGGLVTDHVAFPGAANCPAATQAPQSGSSPAVLVQTCAAATPNATIQGSALYDEALAIVKRYYVGRSGLTDQQLLYGSIKGMIDSLGDTGHSTFLTADQYAAWQASLSANVAGVGVMMSNDNGVYKIDRVIPGAPAEKAGLRAGDVITAVDGVSTSTLTFTEMGDKIRGAVGTKVIITVLHVGVMTPVDITITRANVVVPAADWGMIPGTHIADIVLNVFAQGAAKELQTKITAATKAGATSIILDLRGNPGGYASQAQDVASEFLSSGIVYIEQDAKGTNTEIKVNPGIAHNTTIPIVVLVDHNSASSAEIVAGAMQDHGRAKIVGVPTFGTGTVLQQFPLSDGSVIILGVAWWLTPNGHKIFGKGIQPDEVVQMPAGVYPIYPLDLATMSASQLSASGDAQLLAAIKDLGN
jgi:carboxyl-terminal processing protease